MTALPDLELVAAEVHAAWIAMKQAQGMQSRLSERLEELMVPYDQLSEEAKELDRGTVRTVYAAIARLQAATADAGGRKQVPDAR